MFETIDHIKLAQATGGLRTGDGGCVRPAPPPFPFPPPPPPPFDWKKITFPSAA